MEAVSQLWLEGGVTTEEKAQRDAMLLALKREGAKECGMPLPTRNGMESEALLESPEKKQSLVRPISNCYPTKL